MRGLSWLESGENGGYVILEQFYKTFIIIVVSVSVVGVVSCSTTEINSFLTE